MHIAEACHLPLWLSSLALSRDIGWRGELICSKDRATASVSILFMDFLQDATRFWGEVSDRRPKAEAKVGGREEVGHSARRRRDGCLRRGSWANTSVGRFRWCSLRAHGLESEPACFIQDLGCACVVMGRMHFGARGLDRSAVLRSGASCPVGQFRHG